ncbi:MAG: hypothetical protein ACLFTI_09290 [Anaerolineales bacterium]
MSDNNVFLVGGAGGDPTYDIDASGKEVSFKYGDSIDSIKIGDKKYGGDGGDKTTTVTMPTAGIIELQELQCRVQDGRMLINYLKFRADGNLVTAGKTQSDAALIQCDLMVKITGIHCGSMIDAIQFEVQGLP